MILSQHTEIGIQSIMHSQMSDMERESSCFHQKSWLT